MKYIYSFYSFFLKIYKLSTFLLLNLAFYSYILLTYKLFSIYTKDFSYLTLYFTTN